MLMNEGGREARIHYLAGSFRLLAHDDYVRCAITGARIPLDELRYWSVDTQEAFRGPEEALQRWRELQKA